MRTSLVSRPASCLCTSANHEQTSQHVNRALIQGRRTIFESSASYITDYTQLLDMSSNNTDSLDAIAQELIEQLPAAYAYKLSLRTITDFTLALLAGILFFLLQVISIRFIRVRFIKWYTVLVLYDIFLTFELELRNIWHGKMNIMKILFIMNRYFSLFSFYTQIAISFYHPATDAVCIF